MGETVKAIVSGGFTVSDEHLFTDLHALHETERLFVEPSACAGFAGAVELSKMTDYLESSGLGAHWENAAHHRLGDGRRARAGRRTRKVPRKLKRDKKKDFTQCVKSFFFAPRRGGEPRYAGIMVRV